MHHEIDFNHLQQDEPPCRYVPSSAAPVRATADEATERTSDCGKPKEQGDAPCAVLLLHLPADGHHERHVGEDVVEALMHEYR